MVVRVQAESIGKTIRMALADILIAAGCGGMLVWAWGMLETTLYQHVQKRQFEHVLLEPPPGPPAVLPSTTPAPAARKAPAAFKVLGAGLFGRDPLVLGEIEAPRLDLSVIVREGMDDATLRKAAGHMPGTALPGEPGNFVVLGHRDTLFRPLRGLEKGDSVSVRTARGDFKYWIDSVEVVSPDNVEIRETEEAGITLVTCFPFDFIGPAPRRFIARGHLISGF